MLFLSMFQLLHTNRLREVEMTKENFIKNCIDGDFEIPNIGHYRIEKTDKGFISYNEMN